ncbi:hypothetical protein ACH4FX_41330 [Streptomyces sp. NPDC018019]|uniref:hypothetical protein n=1 Tax=Streptomyces sp. NPDC018019 TaxID=3365030 RepID=UPI00379CB8E5
MGGQRDLARCGEFFGQRGPARGSEVIGIGDAAADRVAQRDHVVGGGAHGRVLDEDAQRDQRAGDLAAGPVALVTQSLDPFGAGALEDGVSALPHRCAVVAGGVGQRGDGLQTVTADCLPMADEDRAFGGPLLEAPRDECALQGGDDGEASGDEGG